ncbi:Transposase [Thalassoglobus neptunius]|uniref:Transposase n=1 Tax=Thalassoglobus neptunius TaxID=1938619 RepID=A0A5C5UWH7_9PLAN|nr:Transposase [Thalassoglobus neptunius]
MHKEFKEEAVQMLLDGHTAASIAERLGLSGTNLLYRWKRELIGQAGKTAATLETRVRDLERELQRVERERDILRCCFANHRFDKRCAASAARSRRMNTLAGTGERRVHCSGPARDQRGVFGRAGVPGSGREPFGICSLVRRTRDAS